MQKQNLTSFLKYGFFLTPQNSRFNIDLSGINKIRYEKVPFEDLVSIGCNLWKEAISHNFDVAQKHLVPISGGLDSRAILAGLLAHTDASNIYTYTFGSPNTLDYDVGNYVARKIGTQHTNFDLTKYMYSQRELEAISRRVGFQTVLFHHPPVWEIDKRFQGCQVWSGFMGDPLAGSKLSTTPSKSLEEARQKFASKNQYFAGLDFTDGTPHDEIIDCNLIDGSLLTFDEQLDFQNRQEKFIAPHVLMKGYSYKTPFLYKPWVDFMLSMPNHLRLDQMLYKNILTRSFPVEFSYKTKTNYGLSLNASNGAVVTKKIIDKFLRTTGFSSGVNVNYLDFRKQIIKKPDLKKIIINNISDLSRRGIIDWIDFEALISDHFLKKTDRSGALIILASLEIHIKAGLKL